MTVPEPVRIAVKDDLPEAVRFIKTSTSRMDGLIGAILKLSREGRRTLTAEKVDVKALVERIAAGLQHQLLEANATIRITKLPPITTTVWRSSRSSPTCSTTRSST